MKIAIFLVLLFEFYFFLSKRKVSCVFCFQLYNSISASAAMSKINTLVIAAFLFCFLLCKDFFVEEKSFVFCVELYKSTEAAKAVNRITL